MPNHVTNEIIFRGLTETVRRDLLVGLTNTKGDVDFEVLLPIPLNVWQFSVGSRHEKAFRHTALDWCRENWGTKWNAYKRRLIEPAADTLTLVFDTAWSPPYGWLCAVFNRFKIAFEYNSFDEGCDHTIAGKFIWTENDMKVEPWSEDRADEATHRRLHKLKYGVEQFDDEDAA